MQIFIYSTIRVSSKTLEGLIVIAVLFRFTVSPVFCILHGYNVHAHQAPGTRCSIVRLFALLINFTRSTHTHTHTYELKINISLNNCLSCGSGPSFISSTPRDAHTRARKCTCALFVVCSFQTAAFEYANSETSFARAPPSFYRTIDRFGETLHLRVLCTP